ncbi:MULTISPECIES: kynureninase [unclassified Streptomyces]|uniref:kynureninase n=1 Tax=unclassified Streptomyces TaxID=2593676 RepID=UPI000F6D5761|nr:MULTISPECIES: aminotransferase class V-fold PLP-dependent enzyme [unclassified Streptomyces]AZM58236.1 kynureninase [Streptomyces sp. WAC 01438]RSM98963.1 kynureninase [Streptomyces sp. WAC 01420]
MNDTLAALPGHLIAKAHSLDLADPLASYRSRFVEADGLVAYLDGNSLGRPLKATRESLVAFVDGAWGTRLIRAWDEQWMDAPTELGDRIGGAVLGAAPGQTVVADSTTVMLYKLARAAVDARPGRDEVVADTENFPTDRFVVEGIAAERGLTIRWITPDPAAGVTLDQVEARLCDRTALTLLSHVAYKSGYTADMPAITAAAHRAGALVLWDVCHSAGSVEVALDRAGADLAVGCTYKYLNGGPGSPAFGYVASALQSELRQPIQGWMGHADPFAMAAAYQPAPGMRRFISGTPPIAGMLALRDMIALIEEAGIAAVRAKSVQLTEFALEIADEALAPYGVRVASPRDAAVRGGHVTLEHPRFEEITAGLWKRGVIPDFRPPHGLRVGLSPLSTGFTELATGLAHVRRLLAEAVND